MNFYHIFSFASFSLSLTASVFLLILLILVAVGFAIYVYRYTVPEISRSKKIQLISFRSIALALLLFLIFEPVLNLERTRSTAPHIAVLLDDSKSMTVQDPNGNRSDVLKKIISSSDFSSLQKKGDVSNILFSSKTRLLKSLKADSLKFNGGETDINNALRDVKKQFAEKNLQAVVILSDGSYTTGQNPLYDAETMGVPVFVVGIGDSTEKKDLIVKKVITNEIAYVESKVPIDATIQSAGFGGQSVDILLREGATVLDKKTIELREGVNEYPVAFSYEPKSEGVKRLSIHVTSLPGELTDKNNVKTVFIKVLKSKMKIVVIAGAPSADVAVVEQALTKDKNIEVQTFIQKVANTWYTAPDQKTFLDADCIFFIGYPIRPSDTQVMQLVKNALDKLNKPLFILLSRATDVNKLKSILDVYLPFDVMQTREDEMQTFFELGPLAHTNPIVSTGISKEVWKDLPPLFKTESSYKLRVGSEALGVMKINNILFNEPMMASRKLNRNKIVVMFGYGLWQWQIARAQNTESVPQVLIANIVRWLTTREDDKFVRIKPVKEFFDNGEKIEFIGQVYNESYEPVDDAAVSVKIKGPTGEQELVLNSVSAGLYQGAIEALGEGDYKYEGAARRGERDSKMIGADNGRFSVGELNAEFLDTKMNNILLRQIANRSGGKYYSPDNISSLSEDIARTKGFGTKEIVMKSDINLWNLIWLLAGAIIFFALEWYFRKQAGMI